MLTPTCVKPMLAPVFIMIQETELKVVTISPKNGDVGMQFEAQVLLHLHDTDGSQIVVLKTPRRESVEKFLNDEIVDSSTS